MVLSKKIEVRESKIAGHGLYAKERIEVGEMVWAAEPDEKEKYWFTLEQINKFPEADRKRFFNFAYEVAEGVWSSVPEGVESDKGEFMNHCCSPNSIFLNDDFMIAIRTIEPNDEVTYDYACSETPTSSHMPFKCACGTGECRGTITGYDLLKLSVRVKYGNYLFTSNARRYQTKYENGGIDVPAGIDGIAPGVFKKQ